MKTRHARYAVVDNRYDAATPEFFTSYEAAKKHARALARDDQVICLVYELRGIASAPRPADATYKEVR